MENIEITQIDRRYENLRIKDKKLEQNILSSIMECGLRDPICCVKTNQDYILLDGYKRLRSLTKLKISTVKISLISQDLSDGIFRLIRQSRSNNLKILEEAGFIEELKKISNFTVRDIAKLTGRSPAWVSLRQGLLSRISEYAKAEIFAGRFPIRSYLYDLKMFTRVNKTSLKEIDDFIRSVSGKGLSARTIAKLAELYFNGSDEIKLQLQKGDLEYTLKRIGTINGIPSGEQKQFNHLDEKLVCQFKLLKIYLSKTIFELDKSHKFESIFLVYGSLIKAIINNLGVLKIKLREHYDTKRYTNSNNYTV